MWRETVPDHLVAAAAPHPQLEDKQGEGQETHKDDRPIWLGLTLMSLVCVVLCTPCAKRWSIPLSEVGRVQPQPFVRLGGKPRAIKGQLHLSVHFLGRQTDRAVNAGAAQSQGNREEDDEAAVPPEGKTSGGEVVVVADRRGQACMPLFH